MGKERVKNGIGRGQERVLKGAKMDFKRGKNGISLDLTIWNGVERPFFAVPHLSSRFP